MRRSLFGWISNRSMVGWVSISGDGLFAVDIVEEICGVHVAVNIKNPNRSWVPNLGPQQKSTFLPWTGVLEGGLGCIRGVVLGHLARTKMLNNLGWLVSWKTLWNWCVWEHPLSLIRGLVQWLPCSRVAQICRKTVRTWISLRRVGWCLAEASSCGQWSSSWQVWWPQRFWVEK